MYETEELKGPWKGMARCPRDDCSTTLQRSWTGDLAEGVAMHLETVHKIKNATVKIT